MKILVTGGNHGMGRGVAQVLAAGGHEVLILCRTREGGEAAVAEIVRATGNEQVSMVQCDLARLSDVRRAVEEMRASHDTLDGVFVNAGLGYAPHREETDDGMDPHFQVNYLSHFVLVLNLLPLLERSGHGGRVVFNVFAGGEIHWDDLQMTEEWGYERGITQAMAAKRLLYLRLHQLVGTRVSLYGFQIHKTVWSHQLQIIPWPMKAMATVMKWLGRFITIEQCGEVMAPLFTEGREASLARSGKLVTWKRGAFTELEEDEEFLDEAVQERLWQVSLDLCEDEETRRLASRYAVG